MLQVFKSNKGITVEEVPTPTINSQEVLVKVYYSLISTGTETSSLKKSEKSSLEKINESLIKVKKLKQIINQEGLESAIERIKSKIASSNEFMLDPIGYSCAGEIVSVGSSVNKFKVGDRVACAGSGIASHADFIKAPVNLLSRIPDNVNYEDASFTTVGSIALQGIRRANVQPGEIIIVLGLGLLGQLAVQIAKAWGLRVIGIDLIENRLKLASEMGCDLALSASNSDLEKKIHEFSGNVGVDSVIIYASTKSSEPANLAMKLCRKKGRVVVVGAVGMNLIRDEMYMKELDFVISTSYGPGRYDEVYEQKGIDYPIAYVRWTENRNMQEILNLLALKKLNTERLISNTFDVKDAADAFNLLIDAPIDNISILLKYNTEKKIEKNSISINSRPIDKDKIGIGIIGAGSFAVGVHLPNLISLNSTFDIIGISDRKSGRVKSIGKKFNAKYVTTDYNQILQDENIDLVVITTKHDSHGPIVEQSLNNSKNVFVEKPLCLTWDQLNRISKALEKNDKQLFVGFNRRYSPFIIKIKELIKNDNNCPIFINYRINAGYVAKDHWVQDPEIGGGRILGEVCHFIDLVNFVVEDDIKRYDVINIPVNGQNIYSDDNLALNILYNNGSIAQISYLSNGSPKLPKERFELFCGGKSYIINDFLNMELYGFNEKVIKLKKQDKGHKKELEEVFNKLKGKPSMIPDIKYDLLATKLTLEIMDKIKGINTLTDNNVNDMNENLLSNYNS